MRCCQNDNCRCDRYGYPTKWPYPHTVRLHIINRYSMLMRLVLPRRLYYVVAFDRQQEKDKSRSFRVAD